jgi:hypothetical protein
MEFLSSMLQVELIYRRMSGGTGGPDTGRAVMVPEPQKYEALPK